MQRLAKYNDGVRYLFCSIDSLSKYACVRSLNNRRGKSVIEAFRSIFQERGKPDLVNSDKGSEFRDGGVQRFLRGGGGGGIGCYFSVYPDIKASIVERFQRTLKQRLYRYMTHHNTFRYIDDLQNIVQDYNHSYHRSIGMTPARVNESNEDLVWSRLYRKSIGRYPNFSKKYDVRKFKVGDSVRLSRLKGKFEKGYTPSWTDEIFVVSQHIPRKPFSVYKIKDLLGEELEGTFYAAELESFNKPDEVFKIEKIIKTKKVRRVTHYLVKWINYPPKFNSWVSEADMVNLS